MSNSPSQGVIHRPYLLCFGLASCCGLHAMVASLVRDTEQEDVSYLNAEMELHNCMLLDMTFHLVVS